MTKHANWIFGRGASIACNLTWTIPSDILSLPRNEQVARIQECINNEMVKPKVDVSPYSNLLKILEKRTSASWKHRFITTNWDYLLQRTILDLGFKVVPSWLANSHVFHVNGTTEILADNRQRSHFLLESDLGQTRMPTTEANKAFNAMIWDDLFIVVGISFECQVDRFLLWALGKVENDMPIGQSLWLVVNPDKEVLAASCARIKAALPRAQVFNRCDKFDDWIKTGLPCLADLDVFQT